MTQRTNKIVSLLRGGGYILSENVSGQVLMIRNKDEAAEKNKSEAIRTIIGD